MAKQSFLDRLSEWMRGRNGSDELGLAALAVSVVLLLADVLAGTRWLSAVALLFAVYAWWRVSSRDLAKRRAENRAFLKRLGPAASILRNPKAAAEERRAYKHLSCPSCHQRVRVPRGKGKLRVTCPSCHTKFDARS